MNIHRTVSVLLLLPSSLCLGQGSLTPPAGPPAPVMKTLDQVEARTPVNGLPGDAAATHIITVPGTYYLTGPVFGGTGKAGIRIEAVNVTLDLNGFALEGVAGSTTGIFINVSGGPVSIRNGHLRFWNTAGIYGPLASRVALADLTVTSIAAGPGVYVGGPSTATRVAVNTAQRAGIHLNGAGSIADHCSVENPGTAAATLFPAYVLSEGIKADLVTDSSVTGFLKGGPALSASAISAGTVERCTVSQMDFGAASAAGIAARVVRSCEVSALQGTQQISGISGLVVNGNTVRDIGGSSRVGIDAGSSMARISDNSLTGCLIRVSTGTNVTGNTISVGNNQTGIAVAGSTSTISGNTILTGTGTYQAGSGISLTGRGIDVQGEGNLIERNSISIGDRATGLHVEGRSNSIQGNVISADPAITARGIDILSAAIHCRVDGNVIHVGSGSTGIRALGAGGSITRNSVSGTSSAYSIGSIIQRGSVVVTDILDNTISPWANLSYP